VSYGPKVLYLTKLFTKLKLAFYSGVTINAWRGSLSFLLSM